MRRSVVIVQNCSPFVLFCIVELHLSRHWLSGSPIIRIGLALRVNSWRIL